MYEDEIRLLEDASARILDVTNSLRHKGHRQSAGYMLAVNRLINEGIVDLKALTS